MVIQVLNSKLGITLRVSVGHGHALQKAGEKSSCKGIQGFRFLLNVWVMGIRC